jgi:hypothetical protein
MHEKHAGRPLRALPVNPPSPGWPFPAPEGPPSTAAHLRVSSSGAASLAASRTLPAASEAVSRALPTKSPALALQQREESRGGAGGPGGGVVGDGKR